MSVNSFAIGERYGLAEITGLSDLEQAIVVFDLRTGALIGDPVPGGSPQHLANDTFTFSRQDGPPVRFDAVARVESALLECVEAGTCDDVGEALSERLFRVSVDGDAIATRIEDVPGVSVIDLQTGTRSALPGTDRPNSGFLGFGETWVMLRNGGSYVIADRSSGEGFFASDSTLVRQYELTPTAVALVELNSVRVFDTATWADQLLPIWFGEVGALAFGPADAAIAIGDEDRLRIVDLETNELVWSLPIPNVADVHWLDQETLLIGTGDGLWTAGRLDVQSIVEAARSVVRRGFTSQECTIYRIDPCPTLDEIQSR